MTTAHITRHQMKIKLSVLVGRLYMNDGETRVNGYEFLFLESMLSASLHKESKHIQVQVLKDSF